MPLRYRFICRRHDAARRLFTLDAADRAIRASAMLIPMRLAARCALRYASAPTFVVA